MPTLSDFLDQLLVTKHGDALTDEQKKTMKADLLPRLEKWISVKTMEEIVKKSPDDANVFMTMLEEKKQLQVDVNLQ